MAYTSWRGAIEFKVSGFSVPVNVSFVPRIKQLRNAGFKLVSPDGEMVKQQYVADSGWSGSISDCGRAVEVGDQLVMLAPEVIAAIGENERTLLAEADSFAPMDTIDLSLCTGSYRVVPDKNAPGAEKSASVIWNGLRATGTAYITRIVMRANSVDSIIAIYADSHGLKAVALPFAEQLSLEPADADYEVSDDVGAVFAQAIEGNYEVRAYNASEHISEYRERRQGLIDRALAGETIVPREQPESKDDGADLLAALQASLAQIKPKAKAKPRKAAA
jgi:non-homologous end joining protein Ku